MYVPGALAEEDGHRRGAGKRSRGGAVGYAGGTLRARSAGGVVGRAHKEAADPLREAAAQEEEDLQAIQGAQRDGRIVQLAITCAGSTDTVVPSPACPSQALLITSQLSLYLADLMCEALTSNALSRRVVEKCVAPRLVLGLPCLASSCLRPYQLYTPESRR